MNTIEEKAKEVAEEIAGRFDQLDDISKLRDRLAAALVKFAEEAVFQRMCDEDSCFEDDAKEAVAKAIAEERERCADLVSNWTVWTPDHIERLISKIRSIK